MHESDSFWKENAAKFCDQDFAQLKCGSFLEMRKIQITDVSSLRALIKLLNESTEPIVLAVAAHDLGQFVKYCDRGKKCASVIILLILLPDVQVTGP